LKKTLKVMRHDVSDEKRLAEQSLSRTGDAAIVMEMQEGERSITIDAAANSGKQTWLNLQDAILSGGQS
jgi:hypothetical protein